MDGPSLIGWMTMTQEEFSARFKGSPIKRAKRCGLLRNVAVALGNWGSPEAVSNCGPAYVQGLGNLDVRPSLARQKQGVRPPDSARGATTFFHQVEECLAFL